MSGATGRRLQVPRTSKVCRRGKHNRKTKPPVGKDILIRPNQRWQVLALRLRGYSRTTPKKSLPVLGLELPPREFSSQLQRQKRRKLNKLRSARLRKPRPP